VAHPARHSAGAGKAGVKAGWRAAKSGARLARRLAALGPPGWVALAVLFFVLLAAAFYVYAQASYGNFAPVRAEQTDPRENPGLVGDIPSEYLRLYQSAAEQNGVPWQILAAWGDVATSHGRFSPYDCVQRIDPTGPLAHTIYTPAGGEEIAAYAAEANTDSNGDVRPVTPTGWMPAAETRLPDHENSPCGPYGWLHQWCSQHTGLHPLAPDPPIAPAGRWRPAANSGSVHTPWRVGQVGYTLLSEPARNSDEDRLIYCRTTPGGADTRLEIDDGNFLCGPMLLNPAKVDASCAELQNPALAISLTAETIAALLGFEMFYDLLPSQNRVQAATNDWDRRTAAAVYHHQGIILFEDENEAAAKWAAAPVEVPFSSRAEGTQVLRQTAEFFPAYWAVVLDRAVLDISDPHMGQEPGCGETAETGLLPGDPKSFARETYCHLHGTAPAYTDRRLAGYTNEGIAVGELAATLWTQDLVRVSWAWNEWAAPRMAVELGDGSTVQVKPPPGAAPACRTVSHPDRPEVPLYSGAWLPFPAVSCSDINPDEEPAMAARLIQQQGWGGFSGWVRTEQPPGCPAPQAEAETRAETETGEDGTWKRVWTATVRWQLRIDGAGGFCPPAGTITEEARLETSAEILLEVSNPQMPGGGATVRETLGEQVCDISFDSSDRPRVWTCETAIELAGTAGEGEPPEPAETGTTRLEVLPAWWHQNTLDDPDSTAPPSGSCGDPYHHPQLNRLSPGDVCDTLIVWSWATAGWNCPLPGSSNGWPKALPEGHHFFPASLTGAPAATTNCEITEADTPGPVPLRPGDGSLSPTRGRQLGVGESYRPLLPAVAWPPVSDPAPHTHIGWTADIRETGLSSETPLAAAKGWTAAKEIAYRARWLAGGVQTEHGGTIDVQLEDGQPRRYVTQPRTNAGRICQPGDGRSDCSHAGIDCGDWQLPAGEVCRSWAELAARAAEDGIHLTGNAWRTAQQQYDLRRQNCAQQPARQLLTSAQAGCSPPTAPPGSSLHQHGYAVDIDNVDDRSDPEYVWMITHAWRWGWRNLPSEPWHWSTTGA